MHSVIAIDPGTTQSAILRWDGKEIIRADTLPNETMLRYLRASETPSILVLEWVESFGMAVGKEVFITCRWCGRFEEAWGPIRETHYLTRKQIKLHHCQTTRATDSNVRQALIDRFGPPGTKKLPGATFGLKKDLWSAFAIATAWWDQNVV